MTIAYIRSLVYGSPDDCGISHHPFAKRERVSMAQLEQAKWILREHGSGTRTAFESAIYGHIADLDVWREYEHIPVIRSMVANGPYLTCLPYLTLNAISRMANWLP